MRLDSIEYIGFLVATSAMFRLLPAANRLLFLGLISIVFVAFVNPWGVAPIAVTVGTTLVAQRVLRADAKRIGEWQFVLVAAGAITMAVAASRTIMQPVAPSGQPAVAFVIAGSQFVGLQGIGQVIDYARAARRQRALLEVTALEVVAAVAYFPHVLAGPLIRTNKFIASQLRTLNPPSSPEYSIAANLVLLGLFKKRVLADRIGESSSLHAGLGSAGVGTLLIASCLRLLFAYFSLSGYIDIARGSSMAFGIRLPQNFARPLTQSNGVRDFWRRWQVTVMAWFRDYIYRPLRGSSRSWATRSFALIAAFAIAGLWHGPLFIVWGALMAGFEIVEHPILRRLGMPDSAIGKVARTVCVVWVPWILLTLIFRAVAAGTLTAVPRTISMGPFVGARPWDAVLFVAGIGALFAVDFVLDRRVEADLTIGVATVWALGVVSLILLASPVQQVFGYAGT